MSNNSGYKSISALKYWSFIKDHNSLTLQFVSIIADYVLQISTAHLEFSKTLKKVVTNFQEKIDLYLPKRNGTSSGNSWQDNCFRLLWDSLVSETLKDAQLNNDLSCQLQQQIVNRLQDIVQFKEIQSKMLVEFRNQMELMLDSSVREVQTQQKLYNESIREFTRSSDKLWATLSTSGDVLKSSSSPFLSSYTSSSSSSSSSSTYNCTRHNECVLAVRGAGARERQYRKSVLPSLLEDLEEIYIDVVNTLLGSLEGYAILFTSKARQESRHYETFGDVCLKKSQDPKHQLNNFSEYLLEAIGSNEPATAASTASATSTTLAAATTAIVSSSLQMSSPSSSTRNYSFHVPASVLNMCSTDADLFKEQLVIDGYSLAELDAKKSNLKKTANELILSLTQSEESIKSMINKCQKSLSDGKCLESYEVQNELCSRRLLVHKEIMTLAAIASQLDLLTQKQNLTTAIPTLAQQSTGSKLTIKSMWKQAFKNLRIGDSSGSKKQNSSAAAVNLNSKSAVGAASGGQKLANSSISGNKHQQTSSPQHQMINAREYQLLEKYSKLFLPPANRYRSDQPFVDSSSSIYAVIDKVSKSTRTRMSATSATRASPTTVATDAASSGDRGQFKAREGPQKLRSFKAAARMVIKRDGDVGQNGDSKMYSSRQQLAPQHQQQPQPQLQHQQQPQLQLQQQFQNQQQNQQNQQQQLQQLAHNQEHQSHQQRHPLPPTALQHGQQNSQPRSHQRPHPTNPHHRRSPQSVRPPLPPPDNPFQTNYNPEKKTQLTKFQQNQNNRRAERRRSCFSNQKSLSCDYPSPRKAEFNLEEELASADLPPEHNKNKDLKRVAATYRQNFGSNRPASRSLEWTDDTADTWSPAEPTVYGGPIETNLIPFLLPRLGPHVSDSNTESENEQQLTSMSRSEMVQPPLNAGSSRSGGGNASYAHSAQNELNSAGYSPNYQAPVLSKEAAKEAANEKMKRKPRNRRALFLEQKSCSFDVVQEAANVSRKRNSSDPTVSGLSRRSRESRLINYKETKNVWISSESGSKSFGVHCVPRQMNFPENIEEAAFEDTQVAYEASAAAAVTTTRAAVAPVARDAHSSEELRKLDVSAVVKYEDEIDDAFDCSNDRRDNNSKSGPSRRARFTAQKSQSIDTNNIGVVRGFLSDRGQQKPPVRGGQLGRPRDYMNEREIQEILQDEPKLFSIMNHFIPSEVDKISTALDSEKSFQPNQTSPHGVQKQRIKSDCSPPKSFAFKRRQGYTGQKSFSCDLPFSPSAKDEVLAVQPRELNLGSRCTNIDVIQTDMEALVPKQKIHTLVKLEVAKTDRSRAPASDKKARVVTDGVVKWKRRQSVSPDKVDSRCYYDQKTQKFYIDEEKFDARPLTTPGQKCYNNAREVDKRTQFSRQAGDTLEIPSHKLGSSGNEDEFNKDMQDPSADDVSRCSRTNSKKKLMHLHSMKTIQDENVEVPKSPKVLQQAQVESGLDLRTVNRQEQSETEKTGSINMPKTLENLSAPQMQHFPQDIPVTNPCGNAVASVYRNPPILVMDTSTQAQTENAVYQTQTFSSSVSFVTSSCSWTSTAVDAARVSSSSKNAEMTGISTSDREVSSILEGGGTELPNLLHNELTESKSSPPCFNAEPVNTQGWNKIFGSNLNVSGLTQAFSSANISTTKPAIQIPQQKVQLSPPMGIIGRNCVAHYSYKTTNTCDLSFEAGQIIELLDCTDPTWWKGRLVDKIGYFPSSHVAPIRCGEKVMRLVSSVNIFDEKRENTRPVKLFKNQIVVQESSSKDGVALIRTNDHPYKLFCPLKYLAEVKFF